MQGRAQEAIACYEHVALLQPDSPEAHANLASAYKDAARQDTAIQRYQRALQLRPDFPEAFANLVHSLQCICDWTERPALFSRLENEVRLTRCGRMHGQFYIVLSLQQAVCIAPFKFSSRLLACYMCLEMVCIWHSPRHGFDSHLALSHNAMP